MNFRIIARPPSIAWDGSRYLIGYSIPTSFRGDGSSPAGGPVFLRRLGSDGSLLDTEQDGLLVEPIATGGPTTVQATAAGDLVVWLDNRLFPGYVQYHPYGSVFAQLLTPQELDRPRQRNTSTSDLRTDDRSTKLEANGDAIRRYGVRSLGLFGSAARGTARPESDLDFVVEFDRKSFDA